MYGEKKVFIEDSHLFFYAVFFHCYWVSIYVVLGKLYLLPLMSPSFFLKMVSRIKEIQLLIPYQMSLEGREKRKFPISCGQH